MLCGNYNGTPRHAVTYYEGIMRYLDQFPDNQRPVLYFDTACHHVDRNYRVPDDFDEQIASCDLVIFVGGLSPELEGEELKVELEGFHCGDRTSIELPRVQEDMMKRIKKTGKPLVFVLCSGGAVALDWEDQNAEAVLAAWYGGQAAGTAMAEVLFGDVNPSGKLPVTFYSSENILPPFEDYEMTGRTYRYIAEDPLYPFGYGLSYTDFKYSDGKFDPDARTFTYRIDNVGDRDGEEVAQLYLTNKGDTRGPVKTLVGFERVGIPAGQSVWVTFNIDDDFFKMFSENRQQFERSSGPFVFQYADKVLEVKL